ncbi:MAG: hypothetical protein LBD04_01990 [Synergistaceae bacterium]|jgi:transposase|nr:hypothetical protein [Synergistaceae bacterium]
MPKPLPGDLRKRIIDAKLRGDAEDKITVEKEVNKSAITKLWTLYRKTGSAEQLEQIARTDKRPDVTLQELIDRLGFACMRFSIARNRK